MSRLTLFMKEGMEVGVYIDPTDNNPLGHVMPPGHMPAGIITLDAQGLWFTRTDDHVRLYLAPRQEKKT